ncbi:unnamed protein product [Paramecium octaurelia]|uniref:Uncharacterized protein n=1 Tax=Paramecium octaurelia TaxID=43137 RepID=A0A8S1W9R5_PAROT|nr:unnamed protein product [Paramecium octaurelia]
MWALAADYKNDNLKVCLTCNYQKILPLDLSRSFCFYNIIHRQGIIIQCSMYNVKLQYLIGRQQSNPFTRVLGLNKSFPEMLEGSYQYDVSTLQSGISWFFLERSHQLIIQSYSVVSQFPIIQSFLSNNS